MKNGFNVAFMSPQGLVHAEALREVAVTLECGLRRMGSAVSTTTNQFSSDATNIETSIRRDGATRVLADVTNTGRHEGTEVVQLYIRDRVSSVTRPVKELKGFERVSLGPGQTKTVALNITPESLAFYDVNMNYVVEPGTFEIMVGTSSRNKDLQTVTLQVNP